MTLNVKLTPWQSQVARDPHRFRVVCAGRRSGKSYLAQRIVLKWAVEQVGLYWIVSPTYKQSKQIHWRDLQAAIPRPWVVKKNEVDLSIQLANGSIIELKGAENPDNLRGVKLHGLVVDEIASIRNWDWLWLEVLRPTLTDYVAPALFISTPKGYNHFHELYETGQGGNDQYASWRFTSYDNPHVQASEIDQAKRELTEDTFAQEYLADFRKHTGLVYKEFTREVHVQELVDFEPVYYLRGLDRGFRNPTAVPLIAVNADDEWYQTHELYQVGLTNPELAERLRGMDEDHQIAAYELETMDSAHAGDITELAQLGIELVPVKKESGESGVSYVQWKIQKMAERLKVRENGRPGYFVHPRCTNTIREWETYRWREKSVTQAQDLNEIEQPEKANDHMMDALADLNGMYEHLYREVERKPWEGKLPNTYVEPSPGSDREESDNNWGGTVVYEHD